MSQDIPIQKIEFKMGIIIIITVLNRVLFFQFFEIKEFGKFFQKT